LIAMSAVEDGQFDDAPGDVPVVSLPAAAPDAARAAGAVFIDDTAPTADDADAQYLEWSEDECADDADSEGPDEADFDAPRVEDEDWEMAERGPPPVPLNAHPPPIDPETLQSSTTGSGSTSPCAPAAAARVVAHLHTHRASRRRRCRR
jgi:hypothetical protein